ncbi:MAG: hypothetical protein WBP16_04360 [Ferruginibacter sp.]
MNIIKGSILITVLALTVSSGIGQSKSETDVVNPVITNYNVDTSLIAVLPYSKTQNLIFKDCSQAELNLLDLEKIDSLLTKCVAEYNLEQERQFNKFSEKAKKNHSLSLMNIKNHKRQYIAVINQENEKEVWVNCFCSSYFPNWRTQIAKVLGGGKCYFNLKMNLTKGFYYHLMVNADR